MRLDLKAPEAAKVKLDCVKGFLHPTDIQIHVSWGARLPGKGGSEHIHCPPSNIPSREGEGEVPLMVISAFLKPYGILAQFALVDLATGCPCCCSLAALAALYLQR